MIEQMLFRRLTKIHTKLCHLRLQPIRVYCFHHVCNSFDATTMHEIDWMPLQIFEKRIMEMQHVGVHFISLQDAQQRLQLEWLRWRKYAVLTFDDGYASLKEVLPWLAAQHIPATLFLTPAYFDGIHYREHAKEQYLNYQDLIDIDSEYPGLFTYGMHGYEHVDVARMSDQNFKEFVVKTQTALTTFANYIPYWAYTWGNHTKSTDAILLDIEIIPVLIDGINNYNDPHVIHRQGIENTIH